MNRLAVAGVYAVLLVSGDEGCGKEKMSPVSQKVEEGKRILDVFSDMPELRKKKKKNWALFCGSGPSMNLIDSKGKAMLLERYFDVWGTNQLFLHNMITPQFMHIEIKPQSLHVWDTYFFKDGSKMDQYKETVFIADDHYPSGVGVLRRIATLPKNRENSVYVYNSKKQVHLEAIGGCDEADGRHQVNRCGPFLKKCSASGSVVLQLMALLRYEAVCIIGIDLVTSNHFWTNNAAYSTTLQTFQPKITAPPKNFAGNKVITKNSLVSQNASFIHATALRGFHLYLQAFVNISHIKSLNFSPYSANIFTTIPRAFFASFARCTKQNNDLVSSPSSLLHCATSNPSHFSVRSRRVNPASSTFLL